MACVTLKRHHEFDPLLSPNPSKRRRFQCVPRSMSVSPRAIPPTKPHQVNPSPFAEVLPKCTSDVITTKLQEEVKRLQHRRQLPWQQHSSHSKIRRSAAPDCDAMLSSPTSSPSPPPPTSPLAAAGTSTSSSSGSSGSREQPLFTMKQVSMICEKLVTEREEEVKGEYDRVLICKLAEQYDAFMKFTYDEIQKRFSNAPMSYVS